jgi:hypothetical protein
MRIPIAALHTLLGTCFNLVECRAASVADIKATIDGAYILEEWHTDTGVFRPPQVEGRVVFLNGAVVTILIDRPRGSSCRPAETYSSRRPQGRPWGR